jgi:hypothetical protein
LFNKNTARSGPLYLLPFKLGKKDGHLYSRANNGDFGDLYAVVEDGKVATLKTWPASPHKRSSPTSEEPALKRTK